MFVYVEGVTDCSDTPPKVWPLSIVMSSVPGDKVFIIQEAAIWKSGWADRDWIMNFVVQSWNILQNIIRFYYSIIFKVDDKNYKIANNYVY